MAFACKGGAEPATSVALCDIDSVDPAGGAAILAKCGRPPATTLRRNTAAGALYDMPSQTVTSASELAVLSIPDIREVHVTLAAVLIEARIILTVRITAGSPIRSRKVIDEPVGETIQSCHIVYRQHQIQVHVWRKVRL